MSVRPVDVWSRHVREGLERFPVPSTEFGLRFDPTRRPTVAWRLAPIGLVLIVLGVDALLREPLPFVLVALLDEAAHLATTLLVLAGLSAAGVRLSRWCVLGAVLAGNLVDLDHLPQYAGLLWLTPSVLERPRTHSVVLILLVLALSAWSTRRDRPHHLDLGVGAGIGLAGHFLRDISGGATPIWWPMSTVPIAIPAWAYMTLLVLCAAGWAIAGRWPTAAPTAQLDASAPGPAALPAGRPTGTRRDRRLARATARRDRWIDTGAVRAWRPASGLTSAASRIIVTAVTLGYIAFMTAGMIDRLHGHRLAGFDTGIFVQGTWLLAHGLDPFVTVRGLPLFGDHASFVLLGIAPLYRVFPHPELLLFLQCAATAGAAVVLNALFLRSGRVWPATIFPLLYLLHPGQQWGVTFEFHPESLAPVFLVLGLHLALFGRGRWTWTVPLLVALTCKEDVSLVVAGIGLLLLVLGRRRRGLTALALGLAWFAVVVGLLIPLLGGGPGTIYAAKNFGIRDDPSGLRWLAFLPHITELFFAHALASDGLAYVAMILLPVGLLALLDAKWLLPAAGPLFLNLASQVKELHDVRFHYLLTVTPFVVVAAFHGYLWLSEHVGTLRRRAILVLVTTTALVTSTAWGAIPELVEERAATPAATIASADRAIALIPGDAPVSASWNLVPALAGRREIYDFPVPFDKGWWGRGAPGPDRAERVAYVVVMPERLRSMDRPAYGRLRSSPEWRIHLRENGVELYTRTGPPPVR